MLPYMAYMDPMGMDINQSSSGWRTAMKVVLKVTFHTARCNQIGSTNQELRSPTETCSPVGEERPGFHPNYRFYETIIHRNIKKNWRWSTGWRFQVNKPNKFNQCSKQTMIPAWEGKTTTWEQILWNSNHQHLPASNTLLNNACLL